MRLNWQKWVPITALAAFLASGVLSLVLPEPLQGLRMAQRVAALGLFLLLLWIWLAKASGNLGRARSAWLGLLGLTLLVGPGIVWVILSPDPLETTPPAWLNGLTEFGYPLVLLWALFSIKTAYSGMKKYRELSFPKE